MRAFDQLSPAEQQIMKRDLMNEWLRSTLKDPGILPEDAREAFDQAASEADRNRTPWFIHEFAMEKEVFRHFIDARASQEAAEMRYPDEPLVDSVQALAPVPRKECGGAEDIIYVPRWRLV